jgi:hypothetical protein
MINVSQLPPSLHTLELIFIDMVRRGDTILSGPNGLFKDVLPNLRNLILDKFYVSDLTIMKRFWEAHPGIERLELGPQIHGSWFNGFESGMLPNLKYLQVIAFCCSAFNDNSQLTICLTISVTLSPRLF